MTNSENAVYRDQAKPVRATHLLTKDTKLFLSIAACARFHRISDSKLCEFISGEKEIQRYSRVSGFKFELLAMGDKLLRYKLIGDKENV